MCSTGARFGSSHLCDLVDGSYANFICATVEKNGGFHDVDVTGTSWSGRRGDELAQIHTGDDSAKCEYVAEFI